MIGEASRGEAGTVSGLVFLDRLRCFRYILNFGLRCGVLLILLFPDPSPQDSLNSNYYFFFFFDLGLNLGLDVATV